MSYRYMHIKLLTNKGQILKCLGLILFFCSFMLNSAFARYKVEIGIDGLTCSQCSRSVEMQLKKVMFLENIDMALDSAVATSYIKQESSFSIQKITTAVERAGFSVRYIKLCSDSNVEIDQNKTLVIGHSGFLFSDSSFKIWARSWFVVQKQYLKPINKLRSGYNSNSKMLLYETALAH